MAQQIVAWESDNHRVLAVRLDNGKYRYYTRVTLAVDGYVLTDFEIVRDEVDKIKDEILEGLE